MRGLYYPLFLLHRYFFVFLVFTVDSFGPCQAFLMVCATALFLYYLVQWRPFRSSFDFALNIFSSIVLLLLYLFCLLFSILSPRSSLSLRATLGFIFIVLVLVLFVVNVLAILLSKLVACVRACKARRERGLLRKRQERFEAEIPTQTETSFTATRSLAKRMPFLSAIRKRPGVSLALDLHREKKGTKATLVEESEARYLTPRNPQPHHSLESLF